MGQALSLGEIKQQMQGARMTVSRHDRYAQEDIFTCWQRKNITTSCLQTQTVKYKWIKRR